MKTMQLTVPSDLWYYTQLQLRTACGECQLMCTAVMIYLLDSLTQKICTDGIAGDVHET